MNPWYTECFSNPSAVHTEGQKASKAIENAREIIAKKNWCYAK
ncbi:hypothetical protein [Photobacterium angustum]|nr:hypothetical protein [Photobacterium angustum]